MGAHERFEFGGTQHATVAPHNFAVFEKEECGHRLNAIDRSGLWVTIDIHFQNVPCIADAARELVENRRLCFARPAPRSEKIDQHGLSGADEFSEICHAQRFSLLANDDQPPPL